MPRFANHTVYPMRIVVDTNIVISGLLWWGTSRQILDLARMGTIELFTSALLLAELEDVLSRPKFSERLVSVGVTAHDLVLGYAALTTIVESASIEPVILGDQDDDAVIACAVAAQGEIIVSGDNHLLDLKYYGDIRVLTAAQLIEKIA